jgi:hypothetical protein
MSQAKVIVYFFGLLLAAYLLLIGPASDGISLEDRRGQILFKLNLHNINNFKYNSLLILHLHTP